MLPVNRTPLGCSGWYPVGSTRGGEMSVDTHEAELFDPGMMETPR